MQISHSIQSDNQNMNNRICRGRIHPPSPRSPVACHREDPPSPRRLWRTGWRPWLPPSLQELRRTSRRVPQSLPELGQGLDLRSQGYYGVGGRRGELHPAFWILLVGLIIPSLLAAESGTFTLVKDGRPAATIVTAAKPLPGAQRAVEEFQYFLTRLTGTNLPVKTDAQPVEGPVVLIGASEALARRGIKIDKLIYDNFIIRSGPDFLAIVGRDTEPPPGGYPNIGTANGVYAFLEDYCGVRMFMPGENGIIAPRTTTLTVPANLDVAFQKSILWGTPQFRGGADVVLRYRWRAYPGVKFKTYGGHTWEPAFPVTNYFDKHPEYYALVGGKRIKQNAAPLCVSNPEVLQRKIEWAKEQLQDYDLLEIGHPDSYGGSCPACECEKCVALGKTLGDRVVWFHTRLAEAIRTWNPSKKLLMLAYGPTYYASPDWKFPDNVIIGLCELKSLDTAPEGRVPWNKIHNQFSIYVYFWSPYFHGFGPANSIREIIDAFAYNKRNGITMCFYCTQPMNWGIIAPQLYLDYRLRMNFDADPQKVLAEFYAGLYGPAAGAMKAFFDCVDEAQNTPVLINNSANRYLTRWPTARTDQALKLLDQAEATVGNDPVIKGRIELSRVNIQYTRETSRVFALDRQYKKSGVLTDLEALAKAVADREAWIDGILKKQTDGYYTKSLGLIDPFPAKYGREGTLRDQVASYHLGELFTIDYKGMIAFLRKHPKMEGAMLKTDAAPKIDGILDEAIWTKAPKMGMFKNDGSAEAPVPTATDIQLAYDQNAVYVAFTVHEPAMDKMEKQPVKIKRGGGEGAEWEDCVEVFLGESGRDARKWVHMIVSFTNARYDGRFGFVTDELDPLFHVPDHRWKDGAWQSAVHLDPEKKQWTVELAIPWATMGFGEPKPGTRLQANFNRSRWTERSDPRPKGDSDCFAWSPTFGGFQDASRFGVVKLEP